MPANVLTTKSQLSEAAAFFAEALFVVGVFFLQEVELMAIRRRNNNKILEERFWVMPMILFFMRAYLEAKIRTYQIQQPCYRAGYFSIRKTGGF